MTLYLSLKDEIIKGILNGSNVNGQTLPTEHELSESYGVSRVTVRKALDELKSDGVISGIQGHGTVIAHRKGGFSGPMDIIALIAAVHNPFFASFMEGFERTAEDNGSLVLFKQDFGGDALHSVDLFFRLVKRNIRNLVIWPQTDHIDFNLLKRLRTVGCNIAIFDQVFDTDVVDVVSVSHEHATTTLYHDLRSRVHGNIAFIGFSNISFPSELLREQAFIKAGGDQNAIYRIPWGEDIESKTQALLDELIQQPSRPAGIIGCNGPIGLAAAKFLRNQDITDVELSTIDYMPEMMSYKLTAYRQPIRELAEKTYQRLVAQSNQGDSWIPDTYLLPGDLVRTEG